MPIVFDFIVTYQ